jgi:hypothetical protein
MTQNILSQISAKYRSYVTAEGNVVKIDAQTLYYRDLNALLRELDSNGAEKVESATSTDNAT